MKLGFVILAAVIASGSISAAAETPAASPAIGDTASLVSTIAGEPAARRPLARLSMPLCLTVAAEDENFARSVAERIIANAGVAGVPTLGAGCTPNALVTFSKDAAAQINAYRAEGRKLFRMMSEKEIDAALAGRDPAYVFQAVKAGGNWADPGENFEIGAGASWEKERSYQRRPEHLLSTLVMFEADAVIGLSPIQIADYASLRLLAQTGEVPAEGANAPDTILSLFSAPAEAPLQMTRADRAYLRSLYSLPRTAFAKEVLEAALIDASGAADERENED